MKKQTKQLLNQLQLDADKQKHPNLPDYARTTKNLNDTTANQTTTSILTYCNLQQNTFAMRINSQGQYDAKLGKFRKSGSTNGVSDIIVCYNGLMVCVEVKVGKDRQSDVQKYFEQNIKNAGGVYIIVHSFDDFLTKYTDVILR